MNTCIKFVFSCLNAILRNKNKSTKGSLKHSNKNKKIKKSTTTTTQNKNSEDPSANKE